MRKPIATAHMRLEQSGGVKLGRTSNDKRNHAASQGKAKTPTMNASESSLEASLLLAFEMWLTQRHERWGMPCGWVFRRAGRFGRAWLASPLLRRKEGIYGSRMLTGLNRITPIGSASDGGCQAARHGQFPSGCRKPQEANCRPVMGRIGPYPRRKPADVGLVGRLIAVVRNAKHG